MYYIRIYLSIVVVPDPTYVWTSSKIKYSDPISSLVDDMTNQTHCGLYIFSWPWEEEEEEEKEEEEEEEEELVEEEEEEEEVEEKEEDEEEEVVVEEEKEEE